MTDSKLLSHIGEVLETHQFSFRTQQCYLDWIYRFFWFFETKNPRQLGASEASEFLSFLASEKKMAFSSQNQAFHALLFLFKFIFKKPLKELEFVRVKQDKSLPVILKRNEISAILSQLRGETSLMVHLMYGSGLGLRECLRLRIRNLDFDNKKIKVCRIEGHEERTTLMPEKIQDRLKHRVNLIKFKYAQRINDELIGASLPPIIESRFPEAALQLQWQYIFPSDRPTEDPGSGQLKWHHRSESFIRKAVKQAVKKLGIPKHVSCYTFRHSFALHLLEEGCDIRVVQKLLGHSNVRTTMIYHQVLDQRRIQVKSPLDTLELV